MFKLICGILRNARACVSAAQAKRATSVGEIKMKQKEKKTREYGAI